MADASRDASPQAGQNRDGPGEMAGSPSSSDPLFTGVGTVCDTAARLTGVDGAAVAVLTHTTRIRELVYATDMLAQQIDELQFTLGEGPCLDAYRDDRPHLHPLLDDPVPWSRWPLFAAEVAALGVRAVFAFPVPGEHHPLAVLELYRRTAGGLDTAEQESAMVCATAIGHTLRSNWDIHVAAHSGHAEGAVEAAALMVAADGERADHFTRSQIHVAAGMVAVQLAVTSDEGVDRLRAYAYAQGRSITTVAADIVERRLSLHDQRDTKRDA